VSCRRANRNRPKICLANPNRYNRESNFFKKNKFMIINALPAAPIAPNTDAVILRLVGADAEKESGASSNKNGGRPLDEQAKKDDETALSLSKSSLTELPLGSPERALRDAASGNQSNSKTIDGGSHAVIERALETVPDAMRASLATAVMANLSGAFAAADSAIQAVGKDRSSSSESPGVFSGPATAIAGAAMNVICETVWNDISIPINKKMEIIFKLMVEVMMEAQAIDAKVAAAAKAAAATGAKNGWLPPLQFPPGNQTDAENKAFPLSIAA